MYVHAGRWKMVYLTADWPQEGEEGSTKNPEDHEARRQSDDHWSNQVTIWWANNCMLLSCLAENDPFHISEATVFMH